MNKKFVILLAFLALSGIGSLIFIATNYYQSHSTPRSTTSNPQSFNSFYASVDKIDGNTLYTTRKLGPDITKSYKININQNTQIKTSFQAQPGAMLILSVTPEKTKANLSDLKIGQIILISTLADINDPEVKEFDADIIEPLPMINVINGKIISVEENKLVIQALPPITTNEVSLTKQTQSQQKEFKINLLSTTQIFKSTLTSQYPTYKYEQVIQKDLQKDMRISVFADSSILSKDEINANYIEIVPDIEPPLITSTEINPAAENPISTKSASK